MIDLLAACMFLGPLPDPVCTPGDIQSRSAKVVCTPGWASRHRHVTQATKALVYASYRLTGPHPFPEWEVDHRIPLEIGGSNSTRNLWPEHNPQSKDRLENRTHEKVCTGRMSLSHAQRIFKGDWTKESRSA